jgi:hypothetical protein
MGYGKKTHQTRRRPWQKLATKPSHEKGLIHLREIDGVVGTVLILDDSKPPAELRKTSRRMLPVKKAEVVSALRVTWTAWPTRKPA